MGVDAVGANSVRPLIIISCHDIVLALIELMCWHSHSESAKIQLMFTLFSHNEHIAGVS